MLRRVAARGGDAATAHLARDRHMALSCARRRRRQQIALARNNEQNGRSQATKKSPSGR